MKRLRKKWGFSQHEFQKSKYFFKKFYPCSQPIIQPFFQFFHKNLVVVG